MNATPGADLWSRPLKELASEICPNSPLDLGIVRAVHIFREHDVHTYESCEGGEGHAYPEPTVRFYGHYGEGFRVLAIALTYRLPVLHLARVWNVDDGEPTGPHWQIVFRSMIP